MAWILRACSGLNASSNGRGAAPAGEAPAWGPAAGRAAVLAQPALAAAPIKQQSAKAGATGQMKPPAGWRVRDGSGADMPHN